MAGHLPISVLSRALRNRVIRTQTVHSGAQCLTKGASLSRFQRPFSTEPPTTSDPVPSENTHETEHETLPRSEPAQSLHDDKTASGKKPEVSAKGGKTNPKLEEQTLMDIASGVTTNGSGFSSKSIALEMQWLSDPKDLGDRVGRLLRSDDIAQAAALTREAQRRQVRCELAWNHLMRYAMEKGYPEVAFKFYNDMKKRGRMPNAKTYTIMLQGFGMQPQSRAMVKKAESVYRSIFSKQSKVKPNVIHANAMLGVCQRHGDIDTLWRIAAEMPDEGPEKPDQRTYSIILAALQHSARNDIQKLDPSQVDQIIARQEKMVLEGKRIWADVVYQWKHDELALNNQVVNAMAYLLLDGVHDTDFYDVLALYNQTMGVPILAKKPTVNTTIARRRAAFKLKTDYRSQRQVAAMDASSKPASAEEDVPFVDENNRPIQPDAENNEIETEESIEAEEMEEEEDFETLFDPITTEAQQSSPPLKPDNKDLTMILTACFNMTQGSGHGPSYWNLLTKESDTLLIEPDQVSSMEYIRLLRQTRSSKIAVQTIREQLLPAGYADGKFFHVAFAACRRDRRNKGVLTFMNELFELMHKAMVLPDPRVLEGYLRFIQALSEDPQSLLYMRGLEVKPGKQTLQALGKELQAKLNILAISTLRPHVNQLHEAMVHGKPAPRNRWNSLKGGSGTLNGDECVKILARIRTLIDETLKSEYTQFVPKAERKVLIEESKLLKTYSDKSTIKDFRTKLVFPTTAQRNAFKEQQSEFRKQSSKSGEKRLRNKPEKPEKSSQKPEAEAGAGAEVEAETESGTETKAEAETKPDVEVQSEVETKA